MLERVWSNLGDLLEPLRIEPDADIVLDKDETLLDRRLLSLDLKRRYGAN